MYTSCAGRTSFVAWLCYLMMLLHIKKLYCVKFDNTMPLTVSNKDQEFQGTVHLLVVWKKTVKVLNSSRLQ